MNPTTEQLNARIQATGQTPVVSPTINASALGTPNANFNLSSTPVLPIPTVQGPASVTAPIETPKIEQPKPVNAVESLDALFSGLGNKDADLESAKLAKSAPIEAQLNQINQQLGLQQAQAIANQEKAMQRGETLGFASREAQNIARTDAIESLKLSAIAEGLRGNIALAEKQATSAINAKYAEINKNIETAKTNIYNNYESFTAAEKKRARATLLRLDKEDSFAKIQAEDDKITQGFIQEAIAMGAQNGKPVPVLSLQRASQVAPTEALQILAPYMVDVEAKANALLDRKIKNAQLDKINSEIRKIDTENEVPLVTNPNASEYQGALSVILGSNKFTKEQKASVINSVNNGEDPVVVIKNQAKDIMSGANKTDTEKYETIRTQMETLKDKLADYYAAGGETSIFKGNIEKTINKLGEVQDPELVSIAVEIASSLQAYRNAISGTAYSEQEGKDIASIFPGINKTEGLNKAIIDGRLGFINSTIDANSKRVLGSTYDTLKNQTRGSTSNFDKFADDINSNGIITRSAWKTVEDKDGLLKYMKDQFGIDLKVSD